jgi:hypothetical protein
MGRKLNLVIVLVAAFVLSLLVQKAGADEAQKVGVVSHINVLSNHVEDVSSPEAWKKTYIKDGMSDQDKAIAIWKTVIKYRHQTAPPNEMLSDGMHDPFKTIQVYGYGMCCCASSNVEGLARYLGFEARGRIISQHSVPEVNLDGEWHLLDASVMNYQLRDDGKIASVDEIRHAVRGWFEKNPEVEMPDGTKVHAADMRGNDNKLRAFAMKGNWKKNGPELLRNCLYYTEDGPNAAGWHGWSSNMGEYDWSDDKCAVFDYGPSMGYQLNVQLRPGEKITRNWFNKGRHVNMRGWGDAPGDLLGIKDERPSFLDLQKKFGDQAPGRIGNGTHEYDVPLADGTFRTGALTADNLASKSQGAPCGVAVKDAAKPGVLVIRMPSSYVYLGGSADVKAVVGAGGSIKASFSDNHGLDWKDLAAIDKSGDRKIDLGKLNFGRYEYQLKFELSGAGTGLDGLLITNDIQHSQAPLPLLLEGDNTMTFKAGAAEGTVTLEGSVHPDAVKGKQLSYLDFHPTVDGLSGDMLRPGDSGTGSITFPVETPGDMTRIRTNLFYRTRGATDLYLAEVSFDDGKTWSEIAKFIKDPDKKAHTSSKYVTYEGIPAGTRKLHRQAKEHGLRVRAAYRRGLQGAKRRLCAGEGYAGLERRRHGEEG